MKKILILMAFCFTALTLRAEVVPEWSSGLVASYHKFPFAETLVTSVGAEGTTLELADGTILSVAYQDQGVATRWRGYAPYVVLAQNNGFFRNVNFKVHNLSTGESVEAKISQGPTVLKAYLVVGFDEYNQRVQLANQQGQTMFWKISSSDIRAWNDWKLNDGILIGVNDCWFTGGYDYILININLKKNPFVRAKPSY